MLAIVFCMSIFFVGSTNVQAATNSASQIVPKTKHYSKKAYRGGRWVTVTTYKHGKRITKKVWRKSNHIGHKVAGKTHDIVMGPKKVKP